MEFIQSLSPVYINDLERWNEVVKNTFDGSLPFFWYGGASLDTKPIVALTQNEFPKEVQKYLSPGIFSVLTDYDARLVDVFKTIYENYKRSDFSLCSIKCDPFIAGFFPGMKILEIIPLTLFGAEALGQIKEKYLEFNNVTFVLDDKWHFVFIRIKLKDKELSILYGLIENLAFLQEVVEPYSLNIEAFCALQLGGKSGNWDYLHDIEGGKFFNEIRRSNIIKPKIWITDEFPNYRQVWREICHHDNDKNGDMHFFEANWDSL